MTTDTLFVFILIGVASLLFASGRVRLDIVALLVVLALALSGTLTVREALSGFGDPVVILVAGLLVVGETLTRTGIAHSIGAWIARVAGDSETRLLVLLMLAAAVLGSVMSSTAIVAIFIPVVLNIAAKTKLNASRLLIPLSYAALVSGMLTLIATTPNLVVSEVLADAGLNQFSFFSFTPIGLAVLLVCIVYFLVIGRRLLPGERESPPKSAVRGMRELLTDFGLFGRDQQFRVPPGSSLVGQKLRDLGLAQQYRLWVVVLERTERFGVNVLAAPGPETVIRAGDVLGVQAAPEDANRLAEETGLERTQISVRDGERWARDVGLATVLIHPESRVIGSTIRDAALRSRYGVHVLAEDRSLQAGDALLVLGPWKKIGALQASTHDFLVLTLPVEIEQVAPSRSRAPAAIAILLGMVLLSAFEIVPVVVVVLMAALAAVFTRILSMADAYRAIHWSSLVLIAGMLPIATALTKTGGVDLIVDGMNSGVGGYGPYAMMTAIFFVSAGLGLFLSNTATAVLMAPIAIRAAEAMDVSPYAFAMTVAIAASAAFATPVSTPVVTLVVEPGHYRFIDFVKVGVPMLVLTWIVTVLLIPIIFAF
jgi:di/tricarboxylate transporter